MSSSLLHSLWRLAGPSSSTTRLTWRPLRTNIRTFSSGNPCFQAPPPTISQMPIVRNTEEMQSSAEDIWKNNADPKLRPSNFTPASPYSGRSLAIRKGVPETLRVLDGILARNKVKVQLRLTERHEKKGYKRRRIASERWRNQFANEVRNKVQLVMKMRDRGA